MKDIYSSIDLNLNDELSLNLIKKIHNDLRLLLLEVIYNEIDDKLHQELCLGLNSKMNLK